MCLVIPVLPFSRENCEGGKSAFTKYSHLRDRPFPIQHNQQELDLGILEYRKQTSKSLSNLLPEKDYKLYGLTTHEPTQLLGKLKWKIVSQGVYDIECIGINVRLIVLSKIPKSANNELWRLFSARAEVVEEATSHYQKSYRNSEYSVLMQQLYEFYLKEKLPMTYTLEQFKKDFVINHLREIPTEEVLKQYSPQEFLEGLSPETLEHLAIILSELGVNQIKNQEQ
ncbi:hypothetical protein [Cylindrospermopsis raciborskii]|uniref:hypothetical protein n=1 Tax=Cylindrospermopsis raciborskii TaxID=77022 RepID=UPI00128F6D76|nr:hypothetical protein [Cylindrospermopsis raciborskii]